jgi:hypothetical protein
LAYRFPFLFSGASYHLQLPQHLLSALLIGRILRLETRAVGALGLPNKIIFNIPGTWHLGLWEKTSPAIILRVTDPFPPLALTARHGLSPSCLSDARVLQKKRAFNLFRPNGPLAPQSKQ